VQHNVINGINNGILNNDTIGAGFQTLGNLSGTALLSAITELSGENAAGFFQGAFQAGNLFLNLIVNPLLDGRFGSGGGFGATMGFATEEPPALPKASAAFASAMPVKASVPAVFAPSFRVWGAAYGALAASPRTRWCGGRSDMFQAGVYGSHRWGAANLSAAVAYNFHDVTTNRTVTIAGADMLQARFQANGVGARLEGGYHYATPWLGITPYAATQVQSIALPSYGEAATAGSNQFALTFASQTATTTRTELGAWLDKQMLMQNGALLTLYGRAAWAHEFGSGPRASAIFQALPRSNYRQRRGVGARRRARYRCRAIQPRRNSTASSRRPRRSTAAREW
jgi:hypothetical protein